ncbi:hypothetical protein EOW65_15805 [Sinirhodobacter ferrireducens]|uniref:Uncharacterized protein n=1 Tax=Paenirhodobacter ferrireducens TaxID=1215032 RepID=A0A443L976_9RHOB|nr:hypothetical protein [Sinirhodobacter ferrireducens]RWR45703.1 hypothetical protein EOW65_15805 [Sinirhodobacter ferrireducens]
MSKNVLESRPALKHLMATAAQSSRALKRLMAEARASGDPASVLRTAISEASVVSKSAVRLAIEIGRIHEEAPSELARRGPPAHAPADILPKIEAILEYPARVVDDVIWNDLVALFDAAAADLADPREAFAAADSIYLLGGRHPVTRLERLELLALATPLTPAEAADLRNLKNSA